MANAALLIEDDVEVGSSLRAALRERPVTLDIAEDVDEAIRCLETNRYCGMVLDLALPNGSGFDILRHMAEQRIQIPIVVITRKLPDYVRELLVADEIKLVLPKPVEPSLLASAVLGLCGIAT